MDLAQVLAECDCWPETALRAAPEAAVRPANHDRRCPVVAIVLPAS